MVSLERLWAERKPEKTIFDIYFDKQWDKTLKEENKWTRIRYQSWKAILTLKKRLDKANKKVKIAREEEYYCSAWTVNLLEENGLTPTRMKYKKRISFHKGDVCFDIDMYPGIPPILEIEAPNKKTIYKRVKKLWLQKKDQSVCGTRGLFKRYGREPLAIMPGVLAQ